MSKQTTISHKGHPVVNRLTHPGQRGGKECRTKYDYDTLGQVKSGRRYWSDGTPVAGQQFDYGFDDIGNRTQTKAGGDANGWNLRSADYSANDVNQYTSRDVPGAVDIMGIALATNTVAVNGTAAYRKGEYFREQLSVDNSSAAQWTNISVEANGETTVTGNLFVAKTNEVFTYDDDGNLTSDGRWTYAWDGENRLTNMTSLDTNPTGSKYKLDFAYDAQGRRIEKIVSTNNGSAYYPHSTNYFLYDGWNLVAVLDENLGLQSSFTWGSDLSGSMQGAGGIGGLLVVSNATSGAYFVAYDGDGNVAALVKASDGTISANYEYGPFGEVIRSTGTMAKANPFRFSTKYQDDESDLLYYGFRSYNPSFGRWLSRDPVEERGGINLYGLVANCPVNRYDFLGLTIPGMCAEAYPNFCPCKCISVTVTFSPGNDKFQWGWIPNGDGSSRFGNNMHVVWKVQGPAYRCKYAQRESGEFYWWNLSKLNQPSKPASWSGGTLVDMQGTCSWGERGYTDYIGGTFVSPRDDGDWMSTVHTPPSITLECTSSDGTKKAKRVSIPSPPNPGKFPSP